MFFYLYQVQNLINGKIYVGVHRSKTLTNSYLGSGTVIKRAVQKYGKHNFTKTILETFDSVTAMFEREKQVVNEEFLARTDVYNLRIGGAGGFDYLMSNLEQFTGYSGIQERNRAISPFCAGGDRANEIRLKAMQSVMSSKSWTAAQLWALEHPEESKRARTPGRVAALSEESKQKRKDSYARNKHQQGSKNSQFGKCWITKDGTNKSIRLSEVDEWIQRGWHRGRELTTITQTKQRHIDEI